MKRKKVVWFAMGAFCFSGSLWAQEIAPQFVTLEGLVKEALAVNSGLLSKKKDYEAKKGKVIDAWLFEDPKFGMDVEGQPNLFEFDQRMNNEFMLEQEIPFPSKLLFRGLAASKEAQIAYQEYKEEERQLIFHVKRPYYELFLAKKSVELLNESRQLLEQASKSASARYESGQGLQADILKAHIELSKTDIEIFNARESEHLAEAHFSHLLNRLFKTRYVIEFSEDRQKMDLTLDQLEELALKKRPELQVFVLKSEQAGFNQALAHHEWLPDFTLRYEGRQFPGENGIDEHDTFIGLTVPVWSILKGVGGEWAGANADAHAARAALERARNELLLELHEAYSDLKQAENALVIYEMSILPQAKQQVEVTLAAYEAGKADFVTVIDAQKTLRESRIKYYQALTGYQIALAELLVCCGVDSL